MRNYEQRAFEDEVKEKVKLTRRSKGFINEARKKLPPEQRFNKFAICEQMASVLVDKYGEEGSKLEAQTSKMGLGTVKEISEKIDEYMLTHTKLVKK